MHLDQVNCTNILSRTLEHFLGNFLMAIFYVYYKHFLMGQCMVENIQWKLCVGNHLLDWEGIS